MPFLYEQVQKNCMVLSAVYRTFWSTTRKRVLTILEVAIIFIALLDWYTTVDILVGTNKFMLFVEVLFMYVAITFTVKVLRTAALEYYLQTHDFVSEHKDSFTIVLQKVSTLLAHILFFIFALYIWGVNLSDFLTVLSLFAVALVLIFTEQISKFVNGLVVMFSKDFGIDDYIRVGDVEGKICDIGFIHVQLLTLAGDIVYVPNNILLNKETLNFSKKKTRSVSVDVLIDAKSSSQARDKSLRLQHRLMDSFSDVDQKSFFATYSQQSLGVVQITLEFRINTSSWLREREIARFLTLEAMDL